MRSKKPSSILKQFVHSFSYQKLRLDPVSLNFVVERSGGDPKFACCFCPVIAVAGQRTFNPFLF